MLTAATTASRLSLSLGNSTTSWKKEHSRLSFTSENPFFGTRHMKWLSISLSQVSVASDYSDSSGYVTRHNGYHPLEELKDYRRIRDIMPAPSEIARTTVKANNRAFLIFPGIVHCEPHEHISWAQFQYVIDEFGDIFFEIYDEHNNLRDQGASNPVTALFGMDISHYKSRKMDLFQENILDIDFGEDAFLSDDYFEVEDLNQTYGQLDWGMPENTTWMHPVYFARCLTKAVDVEHAKFMDKPSNGVSVSGILRPTFVDEEFYLRRLFSRGDSDDFSSDYKDEDSVIICSIDDENCPISTIYRLDITKIELFSVYGVQSVVNLQDFQYAEPDVLVNSSPTILENFGERGTRSGVALKALCKKKGLQVERANLIGVDSLGIDVRVFSGTEVRTHRFSFKSRATSACAADKQIQQLLYPRSRRKKLRTLDKTADLDSH